MTSVPPESDGSRETLVEPIAIIGMSVKVPGANSVEEYWRNLAGGVESIRFFSLQEQEALGVPPSKLNEPGFVPAAAMLDDVGDFDAGFFAMTPREAEIRDPQQRLFLELSHTALEDAGYDPSRYRGEIGVYGGTGSDDYQWKNIRRNPRVFAAAGPFAVVTANHSSYLSTFTSYKLDLRGPSLTVHTACSTSLVAVHLACEALRNRECEMALAGAASIDVPHGWGYVHAEGGIMSPDGHCRAFEAGSAGTLWGSGGGVVVLKRLCDALTDGDAIRAVVLSNAINNDGADKVGFTAPSAAGQTAVIAQALGLGGVDPRSVGYVEAHGTGTALGDPIEVAALSAAFGAGADETQWCAVGSVKTNIGHLSSASGVAGLIKTVLALQHQMIPPSLHFKTPNPKIDFGSSPFYVSSSLSPWPAGRGPRRAGVSSFGVGGTNAHVILEEAPTTVPAKRPPGPALIQVSARTPAALAAAAERLADHLGQRPDLDLDAVAFTLRQGRRPHKHRAYVVADDATHAAAALAGLTWAGPRQTAARPPRVAFLFSGQGSQYAGMGTSLYRAVPAYRTAVDECAGLLRDHIGVDLRDLVLATGEDRAAADTRLSRTAFTQPALFTVEYALARTWSAWGVEPAAMIGHSIGEYVAATLAGVFTLAEALRLVARRGALMQSLPAGSMLAVRLSEAEVRASLPTTLSIAAVNTADSCVVAGPTGAVDAFATALGERGVATTRLRTSHAFHSAMMEPILVAFRDEVAATARQAPDRPLVSNLTGGWATTEMTDPSYWTRHLRETVRFADGLTTLLADGDWALVEVGPGGQLAGLARRHMGATQLTPLISMPGPDESGRDHATLLAAAGRLWMAGVDVDVDLGAPGGQRVALPAYPFERKRFWVEPTSTEDEAEPEVTAGSLPVEEWFAVPAWRQVAAPAPAGQMEEKLLLIGSGAPVLELAGRLRATGFDVRLADPTAPESFFADGNVPQRIVYAAVWPGAPTGPDPDAAWTAQQAGFFGVLTLSQALAAAQPESPVHLDILTVGTHGVVGDDLVSPEHATLDGPALTLPLELPWLTVRHVDGPAGPGTVDDVVAELIRPAPGGGPIVALRGGRRWVRDWEPVPLPARPGAAGIRPGDVCLVTGGLGGIGITVAENLAGRDGARIALLSRTPLPDEPEWDRHLAVHGTADRLGRAIAAVRRMRAVGAEVITLAGDVTNVTDLGRVRAEIFGRFGRLDIIVHAAGVPGGGMAEVKERAQAEAVLAPKVRGTLALATAFGDLPLRAVVLCASLTGVAGGFGQVDYCGANAFLDAVAQAGTVFVGPVVSIDWGSWLEVGMAAEVAAPSAFRAFQRGLVSTPMSHPVLATAHLDPASGVAWCSGTIGPRTHWVLDEHRMAGRAVMPGTGHLATVVAAARAIGDGSGLVALRDVALLEPLTVGDDSQAEIRVAFSDGGDDLDFQLTSRSAGHDRAHVRGTLTRLAAGPAPTHDLPAIRARCCVSTVEQDVTFSHTELFTFGSRWRSLRRVHVGVAEEIALLEAPNAVTAELDQWDGLHPALLDEAVSYAATRVSGKFLPMGYGRLVVRSPLPSRFWSHLRFRDTDSDEILVVDVVMLAEDGTELLSIAELVLRRIDVGSVRDGLSLPVQATAVPPAVTEANGIAPANGVEAMRRILAATPGPQVLVTPTHVRAAIAGARALTQQTVEERLELAASERSERTLEGEHVAPGTELERALCDLWCSALGLDRISVHDDFFEVGGNSLVAVQLLAGIRIQTGERVPMRTLFEASTVARMAAEIEKLRTAGPAGGGVDEPPITALPRKAATTGPARVEPGATR